MSITKQAAWLIFRAEKLGHKEAEAALTNLSKEDFDAYEEFAEGFDMEIAKIGIEAQNEAATIAADNPELHAEINAIKPYNLTSDHYVKVVSLFKGTKFERLHLSAAFRVQNAELLLELVKP